MGILTNFSVYGLMIIPLAAMVKGHSIALGSLVKLGLMMSMVQLAQSTVVMAAPADVAAAQVLVHGLLAPLITIVFTYFVLNDSKAGKVFKLHDAVNGDTGAAVATMWCLAYTVLFRWFPWYHSMASRGFELGNIVAGVDAFLVLLTTLAMCRSFVVGDPSAAYAALLFHVVGAVAGAVVGLPLAGTAVTAALVIGAAATVFRAPTAEKQKSE